MDDREHVAEGLTQEEVQKIVRGMFPGILLKERWSEEKYADAQVPQYNTVSGKFKPASGGVSDHGALTGLTDDDHTQYVALLDADYVDLTDGGATTLHSHAGGSGHTIRENGTDQTARTGLNFVDTDAGAALILDDAGNDETEVSLLLYLLNNKGRGTAQVLIGGTVDNDFLVLKGTSSATHTTSYISMIDHVRMASGKSIQDSGGTARITLATSAPHVTIPGALALTQAAGAAETQIAMTQTVTGVTTWIGININPDLTSNGSGAIGKAIAGQILLKGASGATAQQAYGLNFVAVAEVTNGLTSTFSVEGGLALTAQAIAFNLSAATALTVTEMYAAKLAIDLSSIQVSGTCTQTITTGYGLWIAAAAAASDVGSVTRVLGTYYGVKIDGTPLAWTTRYGLQIADTCGAVAINNSSYAIQIDAQDATAPTGTGDVWALYYGDVGTKLATIGYKGDILSYAPTGTGSGAKCGIGYGAGAGGTVTQITSKATTVVLNKVCGAITTHNAALAAATIVSFTLTNSAIAATDVLVLNHISGGTINAYHLNAQCAAGSATINIRNNTAGSLSEAIVIQFAVIKGVNA